MVIEVALVPSRCTAGGALSHAAIVARELGVPGVVGTSNATSVIADGVMITVDGAAGEVRVEDG